MSTYKRNIGVSNKDKKLEATWKIIRVLYDGQWHQNMELKEKTKLSSRTLDKHLDEMKELQLFEKKTDVKNGKHAVLFKATPGFITYVRAVILRQEIIKKLPLMLSDVKDPLIILEIINMISQENFIQLLERIQQNKNITNEEIHFFAECFLWENYKQFTHKLIHESHKIIADINIPQLEKNQNKRYIAIAEIMKQWETTRPKPENNKKCFKNPKPNRRYVSRHLSTVNAKPTKISSLNLRKHIGKSAKGS